MDYYFWVIRDGARTTLVDTGFAPAAGDRRRRASWTTPADGQFVTHAEADDGTELIEVGGHTPGQVVVSVPTATGTVVLASDAVHFYEEVERDRPFAIVADLPAMYRAYDLLADLAAEPGTSLVAGHDPLVRTRFAPHPAGPDVTDLTVPATSP